DGVMVGDMLVSGEGVADQHRVAAVGIERAVGLVGDLEGVEFDPRIETERLVRPKGCDRRVRLIRLPLASDRDTARHGSQLHHLAFRSSQLPPTATAKPPARIRASGAPWATPQVSPRGAGRQAFLSFLPPRPPLRGAPGGPRPPAEKD